ncbi:hypothetical protein KFE25_005731 [Diacronema lutheri]|uniref:Uncharacterized protein n=1 Tax=Diacronema lutheri TaxID=2081491 RepID=A0A8J5XH51_DIALT|nr:hypothetical protein KFE25_005731 [Diacronema lutheri]
MGLSSRELRPVVTLLLLSLAAHGQPSVRDCEQSLLDGHMALLAWARHVAPRVLSDSAATSHGSVPGSACALVSRGGLPSWLGDVGALGEHIVEARACQSVCTTSDCTGQMRKTRALACSVVGTLDAVGCAGILPAELARSCALEVPVALRAIARRAAALDHELGDAAVAMRTWSGTAGPEPGRTDVDGRLSGGTMVVAVLSALVTLLALGLVLTRYALYVRFGRAPHRAAPAAKGGAWAGAINGNCSSGSREDEPPAPLQPNGSAPSTVVLIARPPGPADVAAVGAARHPNGGRTSTGSASNGSDGARSRPASSPVAPGAPLGLDSAVPSLGLPPPGCRVKRMGSLRNAWQSSENAALHMSGLA